MNRYVALLLATVLVASAGCSAPGEPMPDGVSLARADVPRAAASDDEALLAAAAINAFGLDIYLQAREAGDNLVVSPVSIALALAMARAGARGETAIEMDRVLRDASSDSNAGWLNALERVLSGRSGTFRDGTGEDREVSLRIANAPFAQRDMMLEPAYLHALATRFGAGLRLVDYIADAEGARQLINGWVSQQTEQRIPGLLGPGSIDPLTRLTLVNAIYLKAPWQTAFPAASTSAGPFRLATGATVEVPMMGLGASLPYAAGDGWRAVELPYVGGSLALTVIVPDDLESFEKGLGPGRLAEVTTALEHRLVNLTFPKFGIETRTSLVEVLTSLGMATAFDPELADFSGITRDEALYVSDVVHQANIDVDEKGTEAAAATAVVMGVTGAPIDQPIPLLVDRPFIFALRDTETGAILFLGRVVDPSISR